MRLINKFIAPGREGIGAPFQYLGYCEYDIGSYYLVNEYCFVPPSKYAFSFRYEHSRYREIVHIAPGNRVEINGMHVVYDNNIVKRIIIKKTSRDGRYSKKCNAHVYED